MDIAIYTADDEEPKRKNNNRNDTSVRYRN